MGFLCYDRTNGHNIQLQMGTSLFCSVRFYDEVFSGYGVLFFFPECVRIGKMPLISLDILAFLVDGEIVELRAPFCGLRSKFYILMNMPI